MKSIFPSAIDLANQGFRIIPLYSVRDGNCTCGNSDCRSPGKHPRRKNWHKLNPRNENEIYDLFTEGDNVGIITGSVSNLIVLDIDPANDGDQSLGELEEKVGQLRNKSLEVSTGGGGKHIYFRSINNAIRNSQGTVLGRGLDVRGHKGFVVAPPSIHKSGLRYEWLNTIQSLSVLPTMLERILLSGKLNTRADTRAADTFYHGERNTKLFREAGILRAKGLSCKEINEKLTAMNKVRCKPPLPDSEIKKLTKSISRYPKGVNNNKCLCFRDYWRSLIYSDSAEGLKSSHKGVLTALSELMNEDGQNCTAPQKLIADKAGCTEQTVNSSLKHAAVLGWIYKTVLPKDNGTRGNYCKYFLTLPWC